MLTSHELLRRLERAGAVFDPDECAAVGPCSQGVPMVLRPGHGHEWFKRPENHDYPVTA